MNKSSLTQHVAGALDLEPELVARVYKGLVEAITAALKAGEEVKLVSFGVFSTLDVPARTAKNPRTGKSMEVTARRRPRFHPSAVLRNAVNQP